MYVCTCNHFFTVFLTHFHIFVHSFTFISLTVCSGFPPMKTNCKLYMYLNFIKFNSVHFSHSHFPHISNSNSNSQYSAVFPACFFHCCVNFLAFPYILMKQFRYNFVCFRKLSNFYRGNVTLIPHVTVNLLRSRRFSFGKLILYWIKSSPPPARKKRKKVQIDY
jgi:hypothetical protein